LREVAPGDRMAIAMSTEGQVSNENLRMLTALLENAKLPLSPGAVDIIEQSTA
jgi:DNA-binding transcriptional regulator YdaS (Cro superfamily)